MEYNSVEPGMSFNERPRTSFVMYVLAIIAGIGFLSGIAILIVFSYNLL
jgi:hypothetical protein